MFPTLTNEFILDYSSEGETKLSTLNVRLQNILAEIEEYANKAKNDEAENTSAKNISALENLANGWLESSVRDIDKKAAILNGFAILTIAAVIGWVVWGTFEMQNQMVSGMGLGG